METGISHLFFVKDAQWNDDTVPFKSTWNVSTHL